MELSFSYSVLLFILSGALIWFFSNKISGIVDFVDDAFHLGSAFGGTIILALVTNLSEIAIIINGSLKGNVDLAVGNILGELQSNLYY